MATSSRLLWHHVYLLVHAVLSWRARCLWKSLGRAGVHALRLVLRLYGWEGCEMEEEEQSDGTGVGFFG